MHNGMNIDRILNDTVTRTSKTESLKLSKSVVNNFPVCQILRPTRKNEVLELTHHTQQWLTRLDRRYATFFTHIKYTLRIF